MQILIGCAKDMGGNSDIPQMPLTTPLFHGQARRNALQMMAYSPLELQQMLRVSPQIAQETWKRYQHFMDEGGLLPAIHAYTGVVFKHIGLESFTESDDVYMQEHLWITSFLYGLLRPADGIKPYRLEGKVNLPENVDNMFTFWKPLLTERFIESIKADDGILVDLASKEMRSFFDWKRIEREVKVIKPDFLMNKDGTVKNVTVYAKMCRGAMTGYIIRNRITNADDLKAFQFESFTFHGDGKDENNPVFIG